MLAAPGAGGGQLVGRSRAEGQDDEGRHLGRAPAHLFQQPLLKLMDARPIAILPQLVDQQRQDFGVIGIDGQRPAVGVHRLFHLAPALEGLAEGLERRHVRRIEPYRFPERLKRQVVPLQLFER